MTSIYDTLADLLEYPDHGWHDLLDDCERLAVSGGAQADDFLAFESLVGGLPVAEAQELYVRTFEINPLCTLEVGYHLFGETYKRGEFLAHLRREEESFGVEQERQLPDYLPVLLRLVGRMEPGELRDALIAGCMVPAIETMVSHLQAKSNEYALLFRFVREVLHGEQMAVDPIHTSYALEASHV